MSAAMLIKKILTKLVSYSVTRCKRFAELATKEVSHSDPALIARYANLPTLCEIRPHDVASAFVGYCKDGLIPLTKEEQMSLIRKIWDESRLDVITLINSFDSDGNFRYSRNGSTNVIIGASADTLPGWLPTDIQNLNILFEASWRQLFNLSSIDRILAEHVLEHLSLPELQQALRNIFTFLKPGGRLRLAVPDAFHPSRFYYNLVKPGGTETPLEHKVFLDFEIITQLGCQAGFDVQLLEYFDSKGVFHDFPYDEVDGSIRRCARNNVGLDTKDQEVMTRFYESIPEHLRRQFIERGMTYTSLIADFVKPENS